MDAKMSPPPIVRFRQAAEARGTHGLTATELSHDAIRLEYDGQFITNIETEAAVRVIERLPWTSGGVSEGYFRAFLLAVFCAYDQGVNDGFQASGS